MIYLDMTNKTADVAMHPKYSSAAIAFASSTSHFLPTENDLGSKLDSGYASAAFNKNFAIRR